ncbi:hypothetical protein [Paenibacillus thermotolerans]|uniref:hypothetical protein n=1 Tax=Paenibacillus thermotolerans TaxID=3027807 RepID=UPI0023681661|nr:MULTISPECIES: hypothetical protein [unclassified Paenibacillus]
MVLPIFVAGAWLTLLCFSCLPKKLPAAANVLLYLSLSIIDINRLTIFISLLNINDYSKKIPEFLSFILYRNIILTMALIAFTNVFLTSDSNKKKIVAALISYLFLILTSRLLRALHVLKDIHWNMALDLLLFGVYMAVSIGLGWFFMNKASKEGRGHGERRL